MNRIVSTSSAVSTSRIRAIATSLTVGAALIYGFVLSAAPALAQDGDWAPVTGADALSEFMSGLKAERELPNGTMSRGEYRAEAGRYGEGSDRHGRSGSSQDITVPVGTPRASAASW